MNVNYPIIDADGHVLEKDRELHDYLGGRYSSAPRFETYSYFPSLDGWNRGTGVPGKDPETPAPRWLQFLDELGVHMTVLYPTGGLGLGLVQNPEWACVLARAYNSWIADRFTKQSPRLQAVALLPVHEPLEAAKELERAKSLGLVAGLLPAVTWLHKGYGHTDFDPIYEAAESLDMPLTIHGAPSRGMGFDFFSKFLHVHTLEHPFAILIQFTHMVFEGVFVRFPKLRVRVSRSGLRLVALYDGPHGRRDGKTLPGPSAAAQKKAQRIDSQRPDLDHLRSGRKSLAPCAAAIQSAMPDVAVGLSARTIARHVQPRFAGILRPQGYRATTSEKRSCTIIRSTFIG